MRTRMIAAFGAWQRQRPWQPDWPDRANHRGR